MMSVCRAHLDKMAHWAIFFPDAIYGHGHADTDTDDRNSTIVFFFICLILSGYADPDPDTETWNSGYYSPLHKLYMGTQYLFPNVEKYGLFPMLIEIVPMLSDTCLWLPITKQSFSI